MLTQYTLEAVSTEVAKYLSLYATTTLLRSPTTPDDKTDILTQMGISITATILLTAAMKHLYSKYLPSIGIASLWNSCVTKLYYAQGRIDGTTGIPTYDRRPFRDKDGDNILSPLQNLYTDTKVKCEALEKSFQCAIVPLLTQLSTAPNKASYATLTTIEELTKDLKKQHLALRSKHGRALLTICNLKPENKDRVQKYLSTLKPVLGNSFHQPITDKFNKVLSEIAEQKRLLVKAGLSELPFYEEFKDQAETLALFQELPLHDHDRPSEEKSFKP